MKKKLLLTMVIVAIFTLLFAMCVFAAAPIPQKPDLGVDFGAVTTIDNFAAPSSLYTSTDERVLLVDEEGNYVTYPTYYVTKDNATFDFDFSKLNSAQSIQYSKKSVVMVEIPDGVTTISGSYFAGTGNFPACIYVQFPGSVTSYGSNLFASYNSVIRAVEFLDGTEPITMGDGMFGAQHNGGTSNLQYVKFPNNLVSIGNSTFGKSWQNKTIILGENLEKIGTNFFGESTPSGKDTFVYASSKFFANPQDMFTNLFGGFDQWHNNYLRVTLFYTGTQEQAQTFVANGKAIQAGYMWDDDKALIVSASEYDYATHKPTQNADITIVYGVNKCDAFYNGTHNEQKLNSCQFGCARGCGVVALLENPEHSFGKTVSYGGKSDVNYYLPITVCEACENCKTAKGDVVEIDPLFTDKGYSVCLDDVGITYKFSADLEAIKLYKQHVSSDFEYGVVASKNEGTPLSVVNGKAESLENTVNVAMQATELGYFEIKVIGLSDEYLETPIVCCGYVRENEAIYYLSEGLSSVSATGKTYNSFN